MIKKITFILNLIFYNNYIYSAEVDAFTNYYLELPDAKIEINRSVNKLLDKITRLKTCDKHLFLKNIRYLLDTNFPDFVKKLNVTSINDILVINSDANSMKSGILYEKFNSPSYNGCCAPLININGVRAGLDKVDHFFSSGFFYFIEYNQEYKVKKFPTKGGRGTRIVKIKKYTEKERFQNALDFGIFQEESSWGLGGTGVKSYGDLAANYQGFRFYRSLYEGVNPYFICQNGKWTKQREFKIEEYIDDAWDEAVNCSSYNSIENRELIYAQIANLNMNKCPVSVDKCKLLVAKYGYDAKYILHPKCINPNANHSFVESSKSDILRALRAVEAVDILKGINGAK